MSESATPVPNEESIPVLRVEDLTGPAGIPILHDVSLTIAPSATHVLLGPMHAGKSAMLRLVLGLERAERGRVEIDGWAFDAAHAREDELRRVRRHVGVVFDSSALVSRLTLLENVELPLVEHTGVDAEGARQTAEDLLREVGLVRKVERTPDRTSRLDRRRTALARALVLKPRLLLIDEPGHGLDPLAAAELDDTLRAVHDRYGCAMLICSQEVRYAFHWPNAVSVLADGRIVEAGSLDQLLNSRHEAVRRFVDRRGAA